MTHHGNQGLSAPKSSVSKRTPVKRLLRIARNIGLAFLFAAVLAGGWAGYLQFTGNIHTVVPNVLYRSAQLDGPQLQRVIEKDGIHSVLNLRGPDQGRRWYDDEIGVSKQAGVVHADFSMSAEQAISPQRAQELLDLMASLPKPILVHCKQGADRTGLASALFLARDAHQSEWASEWQLSFRYGHVGIPYLSAAYPMDISWEAMEPSLGFEGS